MSFSLYSRIKIEDMKLDLNDPLGVYSVDWKEGMMGTMLSPSDVQAVTRRRVVAVKVSDVLSLMAKSHIGQDDKRETVTITFLPEHAPVVVNYWHVNLFPIAHKDSDKSIVRIVNKKAKRMIFALSDEFAKMIHPARIINDIWRKLSTSISTTTINMRDKVHYYSKYDMSIPFNLQRADAVIEQPCVPLMVL